MTFTNYPFHKPANNRNSKRLFMPVNDFSFSTFTVPMKFQQPKAAAPVGLTKHTINVTKANSPKPVDNSPSPIRWERAGVRENQNTKSKTLPKTITGTATLSYLKRFIR